MIWGGRSRMGFTVRDFNDPIRLLDRHPEWVEALRQRLLTRELLTSPRTLAPAEHKPS